MSSLFMATSVVVPVSVTLTDVVVGQVKNCRSCPIAQAANRALALHGKAFGYVEVMSYFAYFVMEEHGIPYNVARARLPDDFLAFIEAFDNDRLDPREISLPTGDLIFSQH